jgi:hypothetical protein
MNSQHDRQNTKGYRTPAIKRCYMFPKTLDGALEYSTSAALYKRGFGKCNLIRDWPEIVGTKLANNTYPIRITHQNKKKCLVVRAPGAMAVHIQHMEPVILERLTMFYGYPIADRVLIKQ